MGDIDVIMSISPFLFNHLLRWRNIMNKFICKKIPIAVFLFIGLLSLNITVEASSYCPYLGSSDGSIDTEFGTLSTYHSKWGSLMININGERADSFASLCIISNADSAGENGNTIVVDGQVVNWDYIVNSGNYTSAQIQYIALVSSVYGEKNQYINKNFPDSFGKNYEGYVAYLLNDITEFYRLCGYEDMWLIKDQIFDANYYATAYPDSVNRLGALGTNADALYIDYLLRGQEEAKNCNASFNINGYIAANPDLETDENYVYRSVYSYYTHWITSGKEQGRIATIPAAVAAGYTGRLISHDVSSQLTTYMQKYN